ncbi:AMP-binding protein [Tabrizicola sp.]|uniref:AMP-binding protein n=1 Tax=Tabrizicola sp. TaxID=2005166 RepID=UPI003F2C9266
MTDSFRWHPDARLFDGAGREFTRLPPEGPVTDDSPQGLAQVIGLPAFRLGATEEPPPEPGHQPVFETLTSGSTGKPRRIRRTQGSWITSFTVNARFGIGPGARVAVLGRLIHSLSLYGAIEGLHLGAEVHLLDSLRPDRQRQALAKRRITHLYATPAQLRLLEGQGTCPDLRIILVGGSKLDETLRKTLAAMAPAAAIREFYGAAEASFITLADETTPEASVGRPYPGVELSLDPTGEIWVKSPYLFLGYAGTPDADPTLRPSDSFPSPNIPRAARPSSEPVARSSRAEARQKACAPALNSKTAPTRWRDGWLSVGEIGRMEDGYLYLKGRAGRMVTVADQNVFPEEIEAILEASPGITRAAVLPMPDARRGAVLVAMVQGDPFVEDAVMTALRAEFGPLKAPKALIWKKDWPVLPSGKTDLKALERQAKWPA